MIRSTLRILGRSVLYVCLVLVALCALMGVFA